VETINPKADPHSCFSALVVLSVIFLIPHNSVFRGIMFIQLSMNNIAYCINDKKISGAENPTTSTTEYFRPKNFFM
jgi:hypothetical protein